MDQSALDDLLSVWQLKAAHGEEVAPEDLCRDRPELAAELARRVDVLRRAAGLAALAAHETATFGPDAAGSTSESRTWRSGGAPEPPAIAGYEILNLLGRGGMGVVYLARKTQLNRVVALKMVLTGAHADQHELDRFVAEGEALAALSHTNVVQLYEAGTHEGRPYFTLEYVEGGSLEARVRKHPLGATDASRLMEQVARGVQAVHERGIVHRDLKPDNVLLTPDGVPKVADFGLAKRLDTGGGLTRTGAIVGTPSYMAPEQARGDMRAIGPTTDVWALGAILYRVLTGRPPFQAANPIQIVDSLLNDEPIPLRALQPDIPRDLETICLKCLQKDPLRRYPTAGALADDLKRFLDGHPIQARPVGRPERAAKWVRRNKALAGGVAGVTLSLLLGTTVSLVKYQDARANAHLAREQAELAKANLGKAQESDAAARAAAELATRQAAVARLEAEKAEKVADLLGRMFEAPDPIQLSGALGVVARRGENLTPADLLEKAAREVEDRPDLDRTTRGLLLQRLGNTFTGQGKYADAQRVLGKARALLAAELGADHPTLARTYQSLGWLEYTRGNLFPARDHFASAVRLQEKRLPGWEAEYTLTAIQIQYALTLAELEEFEEALPLAEAALATRTRLLGTTDDPRVAETQFGLAVVALLAQDYTRALRATQAGAAVFARRQNTDPLAQALGLFHEGVLDQFVRRNPAAGVAKLRQALAITRGQLGDAHTYTLLARAQLGLLEREAGQSEAALANFHECLRRGAEIQMLTHPRVAVVVSEMTDLLADLNRPADARKVVDDWLAVHRDLNPKSLGYADALTVGAGAYRRIGDRARERQMLEQARAIYTAPPVVRRRQYLVNLEALGQNHARAGRWPDAEGAFAEWLVRARAWYPTRVKAYETADATADLARAVFRQGRYPAEQEAALAAALSGLTGRDKSDERARARVRVRLAEYYVRVGQPARAVAEYRAAVGGTDQGADLADAAEGLARAAAATGGDERRVLEREALDALANAVRFDYRDAKRVEGSEAFKAFAGNSTYRAILERMRAGK